MILVKATSRLGARPAYAPKLSRDRAQRARKKGHDQPATARMEARRSGGGLCHLLTDLLSLMLHGAGLQGPDGGLLRMAIVCGLYPFLRKLYGDAGCHGPKIPAALKRVLRQVRCRSRSSGGPVVHGVPGCCPEAGPSKAPLPS